MAPSGEPMVSVVTAVRNAARFLPAAIESILWQTFTDFEFLLVEDGSTDETFQIMESYRARDPRIRTWHLESDGIGASLNFGCAMARGKYIARMDGDDISLPDRFQKQVSFLDKNPSVVVVGGGVENIGEDDRPYDPVDLPPATDAEIRAVLRTRNCLAHSTIMMRRDVFNRTTGYRFIPGAEDYDLWLRMSDFGQLANLPEILVKYRVHGSQASTQRLEELVLWVLAAGAAARMRRATGIDPIDKTTSITRELLSVLGVSDKVAEEAIRDQYLGQADAHSRMGAHETALQILQSAGASAAIQDKETLARIHMTIAKSHFKRGDSVRGISAIVRALVFQPEFPVRWLGRHLGRGR
jgi:GT2 family glycosyltransferase